MALASTLSLLLALGNVPATAETVDGLELTDAAVSEEPPQMSLRVDQFETPPVGAQAGRDMPAYLGWSQNTRFGGNAVHTAAEDQVSNTVSIPRSAWGAADDELAFGGFSLAYGATGVRYKDFLADSWYAWTAIEKGQRVTGGDDLALLRSSWTNFNTEEGWPYQPSGQPGALTWESNPAWATELRGTTTAYPVVTQPDGTTTRGPVPTRVDLAMYHNHANLFAQGGDVDAGDEAVEAAEFEFRMPVPPGTHWSVQQATVDCPAWPLDEEADPLAGLCGGRVDVEFDWQTSGDSALTGDWRLPVRVTVRPGVVVPERTDVPDSASPQNTLPITIRTIPALRPDDVRPGSPEDVDPALTDVVLESLVQPGETREDVVMWTLPDGEMRVRRLDPGPGHHAWRLRDDGELVEITASEATPQAVEAGFEVIEAQPSTTPPEEPPAPAETDPETDSLRIAVSKEGRPVFTDFVHDGRRLLAEYDVPRVLTDDGPVPLGGHNRHGRAAVWQGNPAAPHPAPGHGRAAYVAGEFFVGVTLLVNRGGDGMVFVDTHTLHGRPSPHQVEVVTELADAPLVDLASGEVRTPTHFIRSNWPGGRLVLETPDQHVNMLQGLLLMGGEAFVRHGDGSAQPGPLKDPQVVGVLDMQPVWTRGFAGGGLQLDWLQAQEAAPVSGHFTEVATFRTVGGASGLPLPVPGTCPPCQIVGDLLQEHVFEETRDFNRDDEFALLFEASRPDGTRIRREDVDRLLLSLFTEDAVPLFHGSVTGSSLFSPDGGQTWGVRLRATLEDPAEVQVFGRAVYDSHTAMVTREHAGAVPAEDWKLRFDRVPEQVTDAEGGEVRGATAPFASVRLSVPELGLASQSIADPAGAFVAPLDFGDAPGGDYEVVVRATAPGAPDEVKRPSFSGVTVATPVPGEKVGVTAARIRHLPGGSDESIHPDDPLVDEDAAVAFLRSREALGAYDGALRPTAWAVTALSAAEDAVPPTAAAYLSSLISSAEKPTPYFLSAADRRRGTDGFAWRPGGTASAAATGLAVSAATTLGAPAPVNPAAFLRLDGGAEAADGAEVSSLEATGLLVLALEANGDLPSFDPWWRATVSAYLERVEPSSPAEHYARTAALSVLEGAASADVPGDDLDAVAYRLLLGAGSAADLAPYQTLGGGLTLAPDGNTPEAFPTALALAALASL